MQHGHGYGTLKAFNIGKHRVALLCAGARPAVLGDERNTASLLANFISLVSSGDLDTAFLIAEDESSFVLPFSEQSAPSRAYETGDIRPGDVIFHSCKTRQKFAKLLSQIVLSTHVPRRYLSLRDQVLVYSAAASHTRGRVHRDAAATASRAPAPSHYSAARAEPSVSGPIGRHGGRPATDKDDSEKICIPNDDNGISDVDEAVASRDRREGGHSDACIEAPYGASSHHPQAPEPVDDQESLEVDMSLHENKGARRRTASSDITSQLRDRRKVNAARLADCLARA